jgi:hypothetical protein
MNASDGLRACLWGAIKPLKIRVLSAKAQGEQTGIPVYECGAVDEKTWAYWCGARTLHSGTSFVARQGIDDDNGVLPAVLETAQPRAAHAFARQQDCYTNVHDVAVHHRQTAAILHHESYVAAVVYQTSLHDASSVVADEHDFLAARGSEVAVSERNTGARPRAIESRLAVDERNALQAHPAELRLG